MRRLVIGVLVATVASGAWTGSAAAQDGAEVEIFWDRNRDGVRQVDEPPYGMASFQVSKPANLAYRLQTNGQGKATLEPGRWTVTFDDERFGVTTAASAVVDPAEAGRGKHVIGVYGASICGTAWLDENADGERQDGEPRIGGQRMFRDYAGVVGTTVEVATGDDGSYCFLDVPTGDFQVQSGDRLGIDQTTWGVADWRSENPDERQTSKFDVRDGKSKVLSVEDPAAEITGFDTAFVTTEGRDAQALDITVVNPDGSTVPRDLRVGERVKIVGRYRVTGPAYDSYAGTLHLPEGMRIVENEGTPGEVDYNRAVRARFPDRRPPGQEERIVAIAVVEKPFVHSEVSLWTGESAFGLSRDANSGNDNYRVLIRALPADPGPDGRRWNLLAAFIVAAVLVVAFVAWRRRAVK
ncbi:hypothetical protein ACFOWZ_33655 [Lentzea rhizosphaerae]|uniref:SD-repeat containing protein B domain-containing protein n=1 Tax=Lentzea rhizosphaerae TaxID=2041025 RepID=A0ABV8C338_9PSEU